MADIELVIKIDEDDYKIMKHNIAVNNPLCPLSQEEMVSKVANGTPLPKGHGDLIDRDAVNSRYDGIYAELDSLSNKPTFKVLLDKLSMYLYTEKPIIEADGAESEE